VYIGNFTLSLHLTAGGYLRVSLELVIEKL